VIDADFVDDELDCGLADFDFHFTRPVADTRADRPL